MTTILGLFCSLWLCTQGSAKAAGTDTWIGTDACRAELRGEGANFGLALDRKKEAYVEVRNIGGKPTLLVIQYASEDDHCGVLRDMLVAPDPKDTFEFECTDHADPKRVVIGVHQGSPSASHWNATKAWLVDFVRLKLAPTRDRVSCVNYNYEGSDDKSDIKTRAAARANAKGQ